MAKMFLWGLQSIHTQITPNMVKSGFRGIDETMDIELLDDDGNATSTEVSSDSDQRQDERMRILWPPIGPQVASIASWVRILQ